MGKYYGAVGFVLTEESPAGSGIFVEKAVERNYYGDRVYDYRRWNNPSAINETLGLTVTLSIVADDYARDHLGNMRYVEYSNSKWEISSIEIAYPRLKLTLGGLYNGLAPELAGRTCCNPRNS